MSGIRTLVRLAVGFALLPLLLHGIGTERTGVFLFATTLTGYFTALDNGINASVTRFVASHRAKGELAQIAATVRGSLTLMLAVGVVAAVVLAVIAVFAAGPLLNEHGLNGVAEPTILVAAVTMLIYWPSRVGLATLQGLERYDQTAWIQIISALGTLVTLALLADNHASVVLLTAVFGLFATSEGLAAAVLAAGPLGVDRSWLAGRWLRDQQIRAVMSFGGAAFLIGLAATLLTGFDRAIVGAIVGTGAIVGYDLAQRPQSAVQTLSTLTGLTLISPVARLHANGQLARARVLILVASFASVVVGAPLGVLVIALSHPFVIAWVGRRFVADAWLLDVFVSFWVINSITPAVTSALYGIGRIETYARIAIGTAIISLPLSIGLVYAWGTVGVIWGTVIPALLSLPIFMQRSLRLLEIPARDFAREVMFPGYGLLFPWAAVVIAARVLLQPSGYPGLIAFSGVALALWCLLTGPVLLRRVRTARLATPEIDLSPR